jgi:hypothetical protein
MRTFWPFVQEHAAILIAVLAALLVLLVLLVRRLSRSRPAVVDSRIRIDPCDLPPCRFFTGSIVAVNNGRRRCNLLSLQLLHKKLKFEISDVTERRQNELTAPDRGIYGIQLPISIKGKQAKRIFFFGYHRIATVKELPETMSLKVTFGRRKRTYLYGLVRALETTYCLRSLDRYPPKRLK